MTESKPVNTPAVLIIRDGWGENPHPEHDAFNAIKLANTPIADGLKTNWPGTLVATSGEDVGLTDHTMGNSEVGHQNIGAGRVVYQDAVRISKACREGRLAQNDAMAGPIKQAAANGKPVHLMCINSDAGVHGQLVHLFAVMDLCKQLGAERVCVHLFSDGRDTGPFTGRAFAARVQEHCDKVGNARIASIIGRYWAMDRDNRWERVARAYRCLTGRGDSPEAAVAASADECFASYYDSPATGLVGDEFVTPTVIGHDVSKDRIGDGDTVIYVNYRGDRPRELCAAFLFEDFHGAEHVKPSPDSGERGFDRGEKLDIAFVMMTPYSEELATLASVAFPKPAKMTDILGETVAKLELRQFRCAETEKFPHVTFFFNDYRDEPFPGETHAIVQSPKVATYDLQPEMSARGVCDAVLERLAADDCEELIVVNFANGDMVGHTGSLEAAIKACEVVDALTGEIVDATLARGGSLIVTADHGNAEQMVDPDGGTPHTAHTIYPVPLFVIGDAFRGRSLRHGGRLADIAPTLLDMMHLEQPESMTGQTLLV
jgi:2,3-bisphosphoglycerate-independent phosphoglycerate mutase